MSRRPSASTRAARESTTTRRVLPKSRWNAQRLAADSRSAMCANARSRGPPSSSALSCGVQRLLGELGRGEVPEVLVEPVGHERADDALLPPGKRRASRRSRPRRCSSRRGRRGRRRSSCSGRSRAASGCRGRPTTRGRAACTPRSRRPARPGGSDTSRRERANARVSGEISSAYTWSPSRSRQSGHGSRAFCRRFESAQRASIPTPFGCSELESVYGSSSGAPTRQEPNTRRAWRSWFRV